MNYLATSIATVKIRGIIFGFIFTRFRPINEYQSKSCLPIINFDV